MECTVLPYGLKAHIQTDRGRRFCLQPFPYTGLPRAQFALNDNRQSMREMSRDAVKSRNDAVSAHSIATTRCGLNRHLLFDRPLHALSLRHARAMLRHAREAGYVDAVAFQPRGDRKEIGIGDRVILAHRPGSAKHPGLDELETGADGLGDFALHVRERRLVVRPAIAPAAMRVRDMHGGAEIGGE